MDSDLGSWKNWDIFFARISGQNPVASSFKTRGNLKFKNDGFKLSKGESYNGDPDSSVVCKKGIRLLGESSTNASACRATGSFVKAWLEALT